MLQFDRHAREDIISHNLQKVYQINQIPSDTQMRERLDEIEPRVLRRWQVRDGVATAALYFKSDAEVEFKI